MKIRGVAHRGYPVLYPENTLTSFRAVDRLPVSDCFNYYQLFETLGGLLPQSS